MSFFQNACKPVGFMGSLILKKMNVGHSRLSLWAFEQIDFNGREKALDVGCGGGANLLRLLGFCPQGYVCGIDYSEKSVAVSKKNTAAYLGRRCEVKHGDAANLPFADGSFDLITAFETVYFWQNVQKGFEEAARTLKHGGRFMVCCEACEPDPELTGKIKGMTIYSAEEIENFMRQSGLSVKKSVRKENSGWICIIGEKP